MLDNWSADVGMKVCGSKWVFLSFQLNVIKWIWLKTEILKYLCKGVNLRGEWRTECCAVCSKWKFLDFMKWISLNFKWKFYWIFRFIFLLGLTITLHSVAPFLWFIKFLTTNYTKKFTNLIYSQKVLNIILFLS